MKYHPLGATGVQVSAVALGTVSLGVAPLEDGAPALVHRALDLGVNVFDCANSYGNQTRFDRAGAPPAALRRSSEEILGKALRGHRDDVLVCTKVMEPVGPGVNDRGLSRRHVVQQVENSLRRLGTDHLDLYYAHHPDPTVPLVETLRVFDDLVRAGKIRYYGLSTYPAWQVADAVGTAERLGYTPPACVQVLYNMLYRWPEDEIVPVCVAKGLAVNTFSPLHGGLLSGTQVLTRPVGGWQRWGMPEGITYPPTEVEAVTNLERLGKEWGHTPSELALAWLFTRPAHGSAIVGPESVAELEASVAAADVDLDLEQLEKLDAIGRRPRRIPF